MLERIIFILRFFKVAIFYLWSWTVRGGHSHSVCFVFCVCLSLFFSQKVFAQYTVTRSNAHQQFQNVFAEEPGEIQRVLFRKTSLASASVRKTHWTGKWVTASPVSTGFDATSLEKAIQQIGEMRGVYSALVVRKGRLVVEKYFREGYREKPHNLKSASKSLLSALTGIAISEGLLDLNQPIREILPYDNVFKDPRKAQITVRHLLTMTTGLVPTSYQAYNSWISKKDWVKAALEREMIAEPGTHFQYSTGNTHILSGVLTAATGMSTKAYAESKLFQPMQIRLKGWDTDPNGVSLGGNNLSLISRDMAKVGLLYLDAGEFGDQQLVPRWWVESSVRPSAIGDHEIYGRYGYLWYTHPGGEDAFVAVGYGGQYIYVSPPFDCVIVITSTLESKGLEWEKKLFSQLREGILGSLRKGTGAIMKTAGLLQTDRVQTKPQHSSHKPLHLTSEQPHVLKGKTTANVVLRRAPDSNSLRMDLVPSGIEVPVFETRNRWHRIRYKKREGWISGDYVRMTISEVSTATSETGSVRKARTIARLNMRSGPDESHEVVSILDPDTQMLIQKSKGKWLLGEAGRLKGWVYADYVVFPDESEVQLVDTSKTSLQISSESSSLPKRELGESPGSSLLSAIDPLELKETIEDLHRRLQDNERVQQQLAVNMEGIHQQLNNHRNAAIQSDTVTRSTVDALEAIRNKIDSMSLGLKTLANQGQQTDTQLALLRQDIETQRRIKSQFQEGQDVMSLNLSQTQQEMDALKEKIDLSVAEHNALKQTMSSLFAELEFRDQTADRFDKTIIEISGEIKAVRKQLQTLNDKLVENKKERNQISAMIAGLNENLVAQYENATEYEKKRRSRIGDLSSELKTVGDDIQNISRRFDVFQAEQKGLGTTVAAFQDESEMRRKKEEDSAAARETLTNGLATALKEISALRVSFKEFNEKEEKLGSDLTELRTEFSENRKLAAKSEQNLKNTGAKVSAEMEDISSQLQRLSEAMNKINSERDGLNLEIKTLQDEVSIQQKADREILEENLKISQDQIVSMSQSIQGAATGQTQFKKELEAALSQLKALNQTFEAIQSGQDTMRGELKEMKKELSTRQNQTEQFEKEKAATSEKFAEDLAALHVQLKDFREAFEATRAERDTLRLGMEHLQNNLAAQRIAVEKSDTTVSSLSKEMQTQERTTAQSVATQKALESKLLSARTELDLLSDGMKIATEKQNQMNERFSSIQKELNIQRLDNVKLASENKALMAQLESARSESEALRSEKNHIVQREKKTAERQMAKVVSKEDSTKSGGITGKDIVRKVGESPFDTTDRSRSVGPFIQSWADAWARQDADAYISNYSKRFRPRSGMGIEKWRQKRRQRIEKPEFIELSFKDLKVAALTPNHVGVTFIQSYRSDTFKDHVLKMVELVWEDGGWKILDERSRIIQP